MRRGSAHSMKKIYAGIAAFCLVIGALLLARAVWPPGAKQAGLSSFTVPGQQSPDPSQKPAPLPGSKQTEPQNIRQEATQAPYVSPIDFPALQEINPDIVGWLAIPETEISYPILRSADDDSFYLNHDWQKERASEGAIFIEGAYNGSDFTDPVTVIYGHRRKDGAMFGSLQEAYSDPQSFHEHEEIIIYLEDRELHYQVFAAVPYDNRHILWNYDFSSKRISSAFFQSIYSIHAIGANFDQAAYSQNSGHVVILSTCLYGDKNQRFLVMAKLP